MPGGVGGVPEQSGPLSRFGWFPAVVKLQGLKQRPIAYAVKKHEQNVRAEQ
jgi:hypothetical protein